VEAESLPEEGDSAALVAVLPEAAEPAEAGNRIINIRQDMI
jgi:hypothetical protein